MNIWGHIAIGTLIDQTGAKPIRARLVLLCFGALLPDLIDKPLMLLDVYPWGRTIGHSVFTWAVFHLIAAFHHRESKHPQPLLWISWGWCSHFLADLTDDFVQGISCTGYLFSGWMGWPISNPDMFALIHGAVGRECLTGYELAVTALAVLTWVSHRKFSTFKRRQNQAS